MSKYEELLKFIMLWYKTCDYFRHGGVCGWKWQAISQKEEIPQEVTYSGVEQTN